MDGVCERLGSKSMSTSAALIPTILIYHFYGVQTAREIDLHALHDVRWSVGDGLADAPEEWMTVAVTASREEDQ